MSPKQFIQLIDDLFSEEEVRTICFDLGIDFDSLPGRGKIAKIRELISLFQRRNEMTRLVNSLSEERPNVPWQRFKTVSKTISTSSSKTTKPSSLPNEWREIKKKLRKNQRAIFALIIILLSWSLVMYSFYLVETPPNLQGSIALLAIICVFYSSVVISYRYLKAGKTAIWIMLSFLIIFSMSFGNPAFLSCFLMPTVDLTTIGYLQFLRR
ncbi:hypothetical protein [Candidatus Leptofilum sp.]|uniref:hypothetical protein n=1 Tax=Candidatus Leptofilum sp. TaxID=3241576 RepID=UPI003B591C23